MATISNEIEIPPESGNSRLNEIIAIALIAFALLLGLCLASYHPNDPSWNAAGETGAHNWIGAVGANVSASNPKLAVWTPLVVEAYVLSAS